MKKTTSTIFAFTFFIAGCASITKGTTQVVSINTPGVSGATCVLTSSSVGSKTISTPAAVTLEKGQDAVIVRCSKECYEDGVGTIASNMESMTAGNILLGGVIGLGVDAATGAMNKYSADTSILMTPIKNCKPGKV